MDKNGRNGRQASRQKWVMLVEDHADTADMVKLLLEEQDYFVVCSSSAHSAYGILKGCAGGGEPCPDLLLYLTLPDMDPLDMMSKLEARPPILIMSAKISHSVSRQPSRSEQ